MTTMEVREAQQRPSRRLSDWLVCVALLLLGLALRLPWLSTYLFDRDSFLFARAAVNYDLRAGYPHPPGYLFYVLLGKAAAGLTGDIPSGLSLVSAVAGAFTVVLLYLLGRHLWNRPVGLAAAVLGLVSPLNWFFSEMPLSYALEGGCAALVALLCWQARQRSARALYASSVLLGLSGGARAWLILFLLPLWVWSAWPHRPRRVGLGVMLVGLASLVWLIPNWMLSGGFGTYFRICSAYSGGLAAESHLTWQGELRSARLMADWLWRSLGWGLIGLGWLAVRGAPRAEESSSGRPQVAFLLIWVLPAFLFRLLVHSTLPGYLLTFLGGVMLLAAAGLWRLASDVSSWAQPAGRSSRLLGTVFRPQTLLGLALFGLVVSGSSTFLLGEGGFTLSYIEGMSELRQGRAAYVRQFSPEQSVVLASEMADAASYYLPEYRVYDVCYSAERHTLRPEAAERDERAERAILFDFKLLQEATVEAPVQQDEVDGLPIGVIEIPPGFQLRVEKGLVRLERLPVRGRAAAPQERGARE